MLLESVCRDFVAVCRDLVAVCRELVAACCAAAFWVNVCLAVLLGLLEHLCTLLVGCKLSSESQWINDARIDPVLEHTFVGACCLSIMRSSAVVGERIRPTLRLNCCYRENLGIEGEQANAAQRRVSSR